MSLSDHEVESSRRTVEPPSTRGQRRRHSLTPRFGLRTLLVFVVLFCLLFAWVGHNAYRVGEEEAAIESLKQGRLDYVLPA